MCDATFLEVAEKKRKVEKEGKKAYNKSTKWSFASFDICHDC